MRLLLCLPLAAAWALAQSPVTRPDWVETLPRVPGRIHALGQADLGTSEAQAVTQAGERARLEVVARLRSTVKGQTVIQTQSVTTQATGEARGAGYGEKRVADTVSVSAQAEDLPGLSVERTFVDPGARVVYALAALDLEQATHALAGRLDRIRALRERAEGEDSRPARWRIRKARTDLDLLEAQWALLSPAGLAPALQEGIALERGKVDRRFAKLQGASLPSLKLESLGVALRCNVDLPPNLQTWMETQVKASGLKLRDAGADFILELTCQGGSKGPELLFAEVQLLGPLLYRIEGRLQLRDARGLDIGRPLPISLAQEDRAEGLLEAFQKLYRRRMEDLVEQLRRELE